MQTSDFVSCDTCSWLSTFVITCSIAASDTKYAESCLRSVLIFTRKQGIPLVITSTKTSATQMTSGHSLLMWHFTEDTTARFPVATESGRLATINSKEQQSVTHSPLRTTTASSVAAHPSLTSSTESK
ncbi:hypothetical protein Pelo_6907 [Pelomyxa schiedti]|nr:hypothetical protein Pelo_6907 [Pelomyxa schiedti]